MIYSERQLENFSNPPFKYETKQVIETHKEIRTVIDTYFEKQRIKELYDLNELPDLYPFLQGSYSNDTNISKSSDVEFVIRHKNVWRADIETLSNEEKEKCIINRIKIVLAEKGKTNLWLVAELLTTITTASKCCTNEVQPKNGIPFSNCKRFRC